MAWVSPKVYAILMNSEDGKDILEGIAEKDQDQVDKELDEFFGNGGKGVKDAEAYAKAKIDDDLEDVQMPTEEEKAKWKAEDEEYGRKMKEKYGELPDGWENMSEERIAQKVAEKVDNGKNEPKKLDDIIKGRSSLVKNKDYDAYSFKKELEENGHEVEYVENRSGTWQDHDGEKFKEYDIKLKNGQHIYFKLIADENYDTKEIITYKNGKNW